MKFLFPGICITAFLFIVWDVYFTKIGVWGFNEAYLIGLELASLPVEEILFFFTVPYATVFIYECLKCYFKDNFSAIGNKSFTLILSILFFVIGILNLDLLYTSVTFFAGTVLLSANIFFFNKKIIGRFYIVYIISLIPFLIVNGILTGALSQEPVVVYDPLSQLDFRIITIPLEDAVYSFILLLLNVNFYEYFTYKNHVLK